MRKKILAIIVVAIMLFAAVAGGAVVLLMMKNNFIAGNLNFEKPDEVTACLNILPETKEQHFDMFLSNSFGFGGTNSTLIVKDV